MKWLVSGMSGMNAIKRTAENHVAMFSNGLVGSVGDIKATSRVVGKLWVRVSASGDAKGDHVVVEWSALRQYTFVYW